MQQEIIDSIRTREFHDVARLPTSFADGSENRIRLDAALASMTPGEYTAAQVTRAAFGEAPRRMVQLVGQTLGVLGVASRPGKVHGRVVWRIGVPPAPRRGAPARLVLGAVRATPGITRALLVQQTGLPPARVSSILQNLRVSDLVFCEGSGEDARWYPGAAAAPEQASSGPGFEPGAGDRRDDCARYESCLRAYTRRGAAHCPAACSGFAARPHLIDLLEATRQRGGHPLGRVRPWSLGAAGRP